MAAYAETAPRVKRSDLQTRWSSLLTERASWFSHWQEISTFLLPRNGRFFIQDRNIGTKRHNNILDNTGTRALRTMAAGMMSGATSPARPWFALTTPDPELAKVDSVKRWLSDVQQLILRVFAKSNTYRALHQIYEELGAFGTAASIVVDDFDTVIHHHVLTAGEYCLQMNSKRQVDTLYRRFELTAAQLVDQFGIDNVSKRVRSLIESKSFDAPVQVIHAIEPRATRDPRSSSNLDMPWRSCYFEEGSEEDKVLSESGFRRFPVLAPRWLTVGGDVYGHSPGMEALGDIKQLQHEQLRKGETLDGQTKPPLTAPAGLKNRDLNRLPGGVTYVDATSAQRAVQPMYEPTTRLDYLLEDIRDVRSRVNGSFFADMFLALTMMGADSKMTATEVAERHEEKMLMLGPVWEGMRNDLHEPLIELTFDRLAAAGALPPVPPELSGMQLDVEFLSVLAQAQRAIGANATDRFVGAMGAVANLKPEVLDRLDADAWVDSHSTALGVDPHLVVPLPQAQVIRRKRNAALAAKEQQMAAAQSAETAKTLATAPTGGQNALTDVLNQFSGYGSPSAVEAGMA